MSRRVIKNASFSAMQTIVSAFLLFFLYRYLLKNLGAEQLGIWAVVLASTSVARLSDMGLSGAALRFVAKNLAVGKTGEAANVVQTASISIGGVLAVLLIIVYPLLELILASVIPINSLPQAIAILPWAMLSLWFGLVAGIFQSALDGCSRMDLRNVILIICNVTYLGSAFWLVPNYGLEGLAKGQFLQSIALVVLSWFTLRTQLPGLPLAPFVWRKNIFKEMFGYALNFQIAGLAAMLFDPIVKFFIAKFGGLSDVAFYEMANQVMLKVRGVLISAYQAIVPTIAGTNENDTTKLADLYSRSYQLLIFIAVPYFMGLCMALPLISILWIGHVEMKFVVFGGILSVGWLLSSVGVPAYFHNIGTGNLTWNTVTHIFTTFLLLLFAYILGEKYGGYSIAIVAMLALVVPNFILSILVQRRLKVKYRVTYPARLILLGLFTTVNCAVGLWIYIYYSKSNGGVLLSFSVLILYSAGAIFFASSSPYGRKLFSSIFKR